MKSIKNDKPEGFEPGMTFNEQNELYWAANRWNYREALIRGDMDHLEYSASFSLHREDYKKLQFLKDIIEEFNEEAGTNYKLQMNKNFKEELKKIVDDVYKQHIKRQEDGIDRDES